MFTPEMIVRATLTTTNRRDATRRDATTKRRVDDLAVDKRGATRIVLGNERTSRHRAEDAHDQDVD